MEYHGIPSANTVFKYCLLLLDAWTCIVHQKFAPPQLNGMNDVGQEKRTGLFWMDEAPITRVTTTVEGSEQTPQAQFIRDGGTCSTCLLAASACSKSMMPGNVFDDAACMF